MTIPKSAKKFVKRWGLVFAPKQFEKLRNLLRMQMVARFQTMTIEKLQGIIANPPVITKVAAGLSMEEAVCDYARTATAPKERLLARSFVQSLYDNSSQKDIGALGFGVMLTQFGLYESAFHYFNEAGDEKAKTYAPFEYFESIFFVDTKKGLGELKEYFAAHRNSLPVETRISLMKVLAKYTQVELLREETNLIYADKDLLNSLSDEDRENIEWFNTQLNHNEPEVKSLPDTINIAVMDYKLLDLSLIHI